MSGIAAIIHFDGQPVGEGQIKAMTARMAHRGPDGISHWQKGAVALGHCALQTTLEATLATMPLADESGQVMLVMDGRIDNYDALRSRLADRHAQLRSRADAELVLHAYLAFGQGCTDYLEGDFAIVIWDARKGKVICLRDHFGHKSFHYHWDSKTLAIATDVAALCALPWINPAFDEATAAEFLSEDFTSHTSTFWKGINRLPAAHLMACSGEALQIRRYWEPTPSEEYSATASEELAQIYLDLLKDAVTRRSRTHRPLACEVSGGLDSSAVFALAGCDVLGFTLDFSDDAFANDLPYARALGKHLERDIREVGPSIQPPEWYWRAAQRAGDFVGYPNGIMQNSIMQSAAEAGCRVVLDGTGGDEWLTGDGRLDYMAAVSGGHWRGLREIIAADARDFGVSHVLWHLFRFGALANLPKPLFDLLRSIRAGVKGKTQVQPSLLSDGFERQLTALQQDGQPGLRSAGRGAHAAFSQNLEDAYRPRVFEMGDRQASHFHVERRSPFDDLALLRFTYGLPLWALRQGKTNKALHRKTMRDILPEMVRKRQDKARFLTIMEPGLEQVSAKVPRLISGMLSAQGKQALSEAGKPANLQQSNLPWVTWAGWQISALCEDHVSGNLTGLSPIPHCNPDLNKVYSKQPVGVG